MPIKVTTPPEKIAKFFDQQVQRATNALVRTLMYVGETCLNNARTTHTYTDQTGNLTSSMGYAVSVDGKLVGSPKFSQMLQGGEGVTTGADYVKEVIARYPQGIALVLVAGMNYAAFVAARGYNVLDSAENLAYTLAPKLLQQLGLE